MAHLLLISSIIQVVFIAEEPIDRILQISARYFGIALGPLSSVNQG